MHSHYGCHCLSWHCLLSHLGSRLPAFAPFTLSFVLSLPSAGNDTLGERIFWVLCTVYLHTHPNLSPEGRWFFPPSPHIVPGTPRTLVPPLRFSDRPPVLPFCSLPFRFFLPLYSSVALLTGRQRNTMESFALSHMGMGRTVSNRERYWGVIGKERI